ncbi:MAG: hypothetical protein ACREM1_17930 [Longimicrobiales bacterium]
MARGQVLDGAHDVTEPGEALGAGPFGILRVERRIGLLERQDARVRRAHLRVRAPVELVRRALERGLVRAVAFRVPLDLHALDRAGDGGPRIAGVAGRHEYRAVRVVVRRHDDGLDACFAQPRCVDFNATSP